MAGVLIVFWFLFQTPATWVSVAFYCLGLILGVLLISQFWTVANVVYDPRQAKRMFGFIGGGAPLGGIAGLGVLASYAPQIGIDEPAAAQRAPSCVCAPRSSWRSSRRERVERGSDRRRCEGREGRQRRRSVRSAARLEAPADHRARDQLRGRRRRHHRAAAEHGGGRPRRARGATDSITRVSGAGPAVDVDDRFRHPGLADEQDPPLPGHRLRADGPAGQPRIHGGRDAAERRALGAGPRARARSVAALHRRQDDPRDPVPAAAERHQAQGEVVRRRHGRSRARRRSARCCCSCSSSRGACSLELAAAQLREPARDGRCGSSCRSARARATSGRSARASSGATSCPPKSG